MIPWIVQMLLQRRKHLNIQCFVKLLKQKLFGICSIVSYWLFCQHLRLNNFHKASALNNFIQFHDLGNRPFVTTKWVTHSTAQKMKFLIKNFFSKCEACLKNGQHLTQKCFVLAPFKNWCFWFVILCYVMLCYVFFI